ncbi:MAG: type II toxin-antitoxin system HipA family toxin [Pseudomonas sp.]|uniref:type II toxin-antitoxin system HipA family toxin n=1 Tax=Pseudomonas sp. TaxID=306 RepID=UPI003981E459
MHWSPISSAYVFAHADSNQQLMGVLEKNSSGFRFDYAPSWLGNANCFSADPLNLPLSSGGYTSSSGWGCFDDATPESWGRKVFLAVHKQVPANDIEWLLSMRGTGAGCLTFSAARSAVLPAVEVPEFSALGQVIELAGNIDQGLRLIGLDDSQAKLLASGSAMGGARPKIVVRLDGQQWVAKLARRDDKFDQPLAEFASLSMAKDAGIPVPVCKLIKLGGHAVLLVKRFDRNGERWEHYLSARSLIAPGRMREGDVNGPVSYVCLAGVIQAISLDAQADLRDLYRRMVFNIAIGNTDDHLRNHGFLHQRNDKFRLGPAFDLLPHPSQTAEQALVVGAHGRAATFENALSMCDRFDLTRAAASTIINEVLSVTSQAETYFLRAGMLAPEARMLASVCKSL